MARDIDYTGPYSKQLNLEIRSSLNKLENMLSESIIQKEKNKAAKEMAKEIAIVNLMTERFVSKQNELFETKKLLQAKGMDLPAIDSTAGYDDFINLIDDVNADTLSAFADEINFKNEEILRLHEADRDYMEGLEDRSSMEVAQGMISEKFFADDPAAYEAFMLSGDIEEIGAGAYGFTPGSELASLMKDMSKEDFEDLQDNPFWRQGFEQGAMSTGQAIELQQSKEQINTAIKTTEAQDWDMSEKIINSTQTKLGTLLAANTNIGLKDGKINPQFLFAAAAKGEVDEAWAKMTANIDAKVDASIVDGGAPNLTSNLVSVVNDIIGGGGNAYDSLVKEVGNTYEVIMDKTETIKQYAISKGLDFNTAKDELLQDPDGATEDLLADPEWVKASELTRALQQEYQERVNVGFYSDMNTMQAAYDLNLADADLQNQQISHLTGAEYIKKNDAYRKYQFTPDSGDPNSDLYNLMMQEELNMNEDRIGDDVNVDDVNVIDKYSNNPFIRDIKNTRIDQLYDFMTDDPIQFNDTTFDEFVDSITNARAAKDYVGGLHANTLYQAVQQYTSNPNPQTKAFVESFYYEWRNK